jgi:hypothetical protein
MTRACEPGSFAVWRADAELRRLVLAIRSAVGIEAFVWLTDIAGLSRDEAVELQRWSASAMLQSALTTSSKTTRRPPGGRRRGRHAGQKQRLT